MLQKTQKRTLIVWCEKDRLIHPSGAAKAEGLLAHSQLLMLPGCGHTPQNERPVPVGQAYYEFIAGESDDG